MNNAVIFLIGLWLVLMFLGPQPKTRGGDDE